MASLASAVLALKASKGAEERTPAAELITKARRFMDVSFTSDMFASFKIFGMKVKAARKPVLK
jgi:hypothetical protein